MTVGGALTVLAIVVAVLIVVLMIRSRGANDGVDSFRRQIDALSPEARRPVVDQVQSAAGRQPRDDDPVADDDIDPDDNADEPGEEEGPRGP